MKSKLVISAIPDFDKAALTKGFEDFARHLNRETGLEVEYVHAKDYVEAVERFEKGEFDLVWFGGLTGVQARARVPEAEAVAQRPEDESFRTVFIRQTGLPVDTLEEIRGHRFSFGSKSSTSGYLMPRYFLEEAGINIDTDFDGPPEYSGAHDKTYEHVESGRVEVGAVNKQYWDKAVEEEAVDTTKVEAFYTSPAFYDYHWTIGDVDTEFGQSTRQMVVQAILSTPRENAVMHLLSADAFIETDNSKYQKIEEIARSFDLI